MKTRKTFFHRAVCMFLTAVMAVTLFTVAAPTEAQAAGLSFKGNGKSTVTIKDTQCYSGRNLKDKLYQIQTIRDWYGNFKV